MKKFLTVIVIVLLTLPMVFSGSVAAAATVQIGANGTARIAFDEDWTNLFGANRTMNGKTTVRFATNGTPGRATRKINVAKSGLYKVEHITNRDVQTIASQISRQTLAIDGVKFHDNLNASKPSEIVDYNIAGLSNFAGKYTETVPITAGTHTLQLDSYGRIGAQMENTVGAICEYISFTRVGDIPQLPTVVGEKLRIEAEDLAETRTAYYKELAEYKEVLRGSFRGDYYGTLQNVYVKKADGYDGTLLMLDKGQKDGDKALQYAAFTTMVDVAEEGYYDVSYRGTMGDGNLSLQSIYIDDQQVLHSGNVTSQTDVVTVDKLFTLKDVVRKGVYLTKGIHTVSWRVYGSNQGSVIFCSDYMDFVKADVPETVCNLSADYKLTVRKCFDTKLSGTFYVAAYKNKELIELKKTTLTNANEENVTEWQLAAKPDTVKIMTWTANYAPLCDVETFIFNAR